MYQESKIALTNALFLYPCPGSSIRSLTKYRVLWKYASYKGSAEEWYLHYFERGIIATFETRFGISIRKRGVIRNRLSATDACPSVVTSHFAV